MEERIEHTYRNYILKRLEEWQQLRGSGGFEAFAEDLTQSLCRVRKRLGGVRYRQIGELLARALEMHRRGNPEPHRDWIHRLLVEYYDPMYDYQLRKREPLVAFRGDRAAARDYLEAE